MAYTTSDATSELVSDLAAARVPFYLDPGVVGAHLEGFSAELVRARFLRRDLTRVTSVRVDCGPWCVGTFYGQQDGAGVVVDDEASARLWLEAHYAGRPAGSDGVLESHLSWETTTLVVDGAEVAGWRATDDGRSLVYAWRHGTPTVFLTGPATGALPALRATTEYRRLDAPV